MNKTLFCGVDLHCNNAMYVITDEEDLDCGVDIEVARDTQTTLVGTYTGLHVGAGSTLAAGTLWSGLIDDVRIYDRVVAP